MGEIQPWDEALYCVRTNACLQFGAWLDQTQYAVGGLYSSTHPPLLIWMMAGFVKVFGESEMVLRLPSAIFASLGVFMMYRVVRLYATKRTALLSAIIFGNAPVYLWYGHHAQLDIPMHALALCTLYYFLKFTRGHSEKGYIIAGIFLCLALLTKAFQALYILPFILLYIQISKLPRGLRLFFILISIAFIVCSWWYIMIAVSHPDFFTDYSAIFGKIAGGTYHESANNWWYYLNQLIVAIPFIVTLVAVGKRRLLSSQSKAIFYSSLAWLTSHLILLSIVSTKMPHFILFLLIPSVLLISVSIEHLSNSKISRIIALFMTIVLPLCTLWSISPQIRSLASGKAGLYAYPSWEIIFFILPFAGIVVCQMRGEETIYFKVLTLCICIVVGANVYRWWSRKESAYINGAREVAAYLDSSRIDRLVVLHTDYPFENFQPQLAYYTNGWLLGWDSQKKIEILPYDQFNDPPAAGSAVVISKSWNAFNKPSMEDSLELSRIRSLLKPQSKSHFTTSRYEVFSSQ